MKITLLQIDHFRNHNHSILELQPFSVIRGANFAGKSSIAQAISMCLTPSTTGLDSSGRGFATKIQRNTLKAILTADIQGKTHLVRRTVTLNTNTTGRTDATICLDDPEWHPSPFEKQLETNRAALAVCLNTDRFFSMDEKDQKSLLAKLALPKQYDFPEETMDAVDKALGEGAVDFDGEPFAVIEKAYKLLYKEREQVNRQVKEFVVPDALPAVTVDAPTLQAKLTEARERQKKLSAERDAAVSKNHESSLRQSKLTGKIDSLKEKIKEEQRRGDSIVGFLSDGKLKEWTKVAEGKAALEKLYSERQMVLTKITIKKTKVESYTKLSGVSGECPTCHQDIDAQSIAELHQQAKDELTKVQNRDAEILQQMKALGNIEGAVKAIADHEKAATNREEINTVIAEKTKLLEDATNELNKLPTHTEVLIPFVKPLDEVDAEITALLAKLQPAMAAEERKKEIATKAEHLKRLQAKAANVDSLVKVFDKDGIKAKLLADHVGGFEVKMNSVLVAWGYKVTLAIEPDFEFLVTDTLGVTTPVKELSGSEQLMFSVALQSAVARAAGIGIVIADKMDTFLPEQRKNANRVLYGLVSDGKLDQVIVIVSDESQDVPKLPNSAFFLVEAGTVRRL